MNQKIKFLREALDLTAKEISHLLCISTYKYAAFEREGTAIPCDILLLISRVYAIDICMLINNDEDNNVLLLCLKQQGLIGIDKADTLKKLEHNLLLNDNTKLNYHSVKKIRYGIQQNIIDFISVFLAESNKSISDFAQSINLDENKLNSIFMKKRYLNIDELVRLSKITKTPIRDIINKQ